MAGRPARPLAVVKPGDAPPAKSSPPRKRAPAKPRSVAHAAKLSRKTMLETVRDKIAASMDDPRAHPRDVMAGAKQLLEVQAQIDKLSSRSGSGAAAPAQRSVIADTPDESWDEDAI